MSIESETPDYQLIITYPPQVGGFFITHSDQALLFVLSVGKQLIIDTL